MTMNGVHLLQASIYVLKHSNSNANIEDIINGDRNTHAASVVA